MPHLPDRLGEAFAIPLVCQGSNKVTRNNANLSMNFSNIDQRSENSEKMDLRKWKRRRVSPRSYNELMGRKPGKWHILHVRRVAVFAYSCLLLGGACRSDLREARLAALPRTLPMRDLDEARVDAGSDGFETAIGSEPPSRQIFVQFPWGRRGAHAKRYEQVVTSEGRQEGSLVEVVAFPLDQYLDPHSERRLRPAVSWPTELGRNFDAFFIEFKPPLPEWPTDARPGETVQVRAEVVAYERDGTPFAEGLVRRTMRHAGYETLPVGDQVFEEAARFEAQSELTFGWLAVIRVSETVWFVRGLGLIRREEHYSGRALWLFRFEGASDYWRSDFAGPRLEAAGERLDSFVSKPVSFEKTAFDARVRADRLDRPRAWSHAAICFERRGRNLRLAGLAVDYAEPVKSPD